MTSPSDQQQRISNLRRVIGPTLDSKAIEMTYDGSRFVIYPKQWTGPRHRPMGFVGRLESEEQVEVALELVEEVEVLS